MRPSDVRRLEYETARPGDLRLRGHGGRRQLVESYNNKARKLQGKRARGQWDI